MAECDTQCKAHGEEAHTTPRTSINRYIDMDTAIILSQGELKALISSAVCEALSKHTEIAKPTERYIAGRDKVLGFLGIKSRGALNSRIEKYPSAFLQDERFTLILDVDAYAECLRREQKMTRQK